MKPVVSVMISLRTVQGLVVGHADMVLGRQVSFWVNVPIQVGDRAEFRLELPGADDTVLGWLEITSGSGLPGELVNYRAHVDTLDKGDLTPFERWLCDAAEGRVSQHLRAGLVVSTPFDQMRGASDQETDNALRRMDERKARFAHMHQPPETPIDELFVPGLFDQQPPGLAPPPQPLPPVRSAPPVPPQPAPNPVELAPQPAPDQAAPDDAAQDEAAQDDGQGVYVTLFGHGPDAQLTVGWLGPSDLVQGPLGDLLAGFLRLRPDRLEEWPTRTNTTLITPAGQDLCTTAVLAHRDSDSVVYQLSLSDNQRAALMAEAIATPPAPRPPSLAIDRRVSLAAPRA